MRATPGADTQTRTFLTSGGQPVVVNTLLVQALVTEDMRVEQANIIKHSLLGSIGNLKEHYEIQQQQCPPEISIVEDVLTPMRIAPEPGPVMTVSILDETIEIRCISGNPVCESMSLSDAPWTNPLDVLQFNSFANSILACVPSTSISGGAHPTGTLPIVQTVCNDNGAQMYDADDIPCPTRLTVGTVFPYLISQSLREAVFIEQCLRSTEFPDGVAHHQPQAFKKCQRDSRDLIAIMAYDGNRDIFIAKARSAYEEFGGLDENARACLLQAYHTKWQNIAAPPAAALTERTERIMSEHFR